MAETQTPWLFNDQDYIENAIALGYLEIYPGFADFLRKSREQTQSTKTASDIKLQNDQTYFAIIDECSRNLIFFLMVTHQEYLLWHFLKDLGLTNSFMGYFEHGTGKKEQWEEEYSKLNKQQLETIKSNQSAHDSSWSHPAPGLSSLENMRFYENELQVITLDYYVRKTNVYRDYSASELRRIDSMLADLRLIPANNLPAISQLEHIKNRYTTQLQEIMAMQVHKPDGSYEPDEIKLQNNRIESLVQNMSQEMNQFYALYKDSMPRINAFFLEHQADSYNVKERIKQMDITLSEQTNGILTKISKSTSKVKVELKEKLNALIHTVEQCSIDPKNKEQVTEKLKLIFNLTNLSHEVDTTQNMESFNRLIGQCNGQLQKSEQFVTNSLSGGLVTLFQETASTLRKMQVVMDTNQTLGKQFSPASGGLTFFPVGLDVKQDSSIMDKDNIEVDMPNSLPKNADGNALEQKFSISSEEQVGMRAKLHNARKDGEGSDESVRKAITDAQIEFTKAWEKFKSVNSSVFSDNDINKVNKIELLIKGIDPRDSSKESVLEVVQSISANLDELREHCKQVKNIISKLETLESLVEKLSEQKISDNSMGFSAAP